MLILVITWVTRWGATHTESAGRTGGREIQAAGGEDSRSQQEEEMIVDRRRGRME